MKAHIDHYEPCIICNQIYDKEGRTCNEHVKTKRKTEVFFHYSCFESIADHKRKEINGST